MADDNIGSANPSTGTHLPAQNRTINELSFKDAPGCAMKPSDDRHAAYLHDADV